MSSTKSDITHVAFVHDWLYHMGGAEAVFLELIDNQLKAHDKSSRHPECDASLVPKGNEGSIDEHSGLIVTDTVYMDPSSLQSSGGQECYKIFTLFSNKKSLEVGGHELEIVAALPAWMFAIFRYFEKHRIPVLSKFFDYRNLMFFYPILVRILRRKVQQFSPDEILVSSFAAVKNVLPKVAESGKLSNSESLRREKAKSVLYLHSPIQYVRDYYEDNVSKLKFPIKQLYQLITPVLRRWDKTPRDYDTIYYNSNYTKQAAQRLYGRNHGEVQYPTIHPHYLDIKQELSQNQNYYIFIGRLVRFAKELDLIIRLCNHAGDKLIVMGSGPDEQYLRSIAGPTIEFVGQVNDIDKKMKLLGRSSGLINITRESFGMVTAEALCLGVPVFGYNEGGSVELVDEQSGILISNKKLDHVIEQWEIFKTKKWDREFISARGSQLVGCQDGLK